MANDQPDQHEDVDELLMAIEKRLAEVVPTKLVAPENRRPLANAFIDFLVRLVAFLEANKPLDQAKMAALLYFVDSLHMDKVNPDDSFIMLNLVGAAKNASRRLRHKNN